MPAKRNRRAKKPKRGINIKKLLKIVVVLIVIVSGIYLITSRTFWDGKNKLSVVSIDEHGDVRLVTFSPETNEIYDISIPSATEVDVSEELGLWKLKNVWEDGSNEKGELLAKTITKNLKFPVYVYAEPPFLGYLETDLGGVFAATISSYNTNLKLGDRLAIAIFSLNVNNTDRSEIDLARSNSLTNQTLVDGERGYKVTSEPSLQIKSIFARTYLRELNPKVLIINRTEGIQVSGSVSSILENMGLKVSSIRNEGASEGNCKVFSKIPKLQAELVYLFDCSVLKKFEDSGDFDLILELNKDFSSNY